MDTSDCELTGVQYSGNIVAIEKTPSHLDRRHMATSDWLRTPHVWAKPAEFPLTIEDMESLARAGYSIVSEAVLPRMRGDEILVGEAGWYYIATRPEQMPDIGVVLGSRVRDSIVKVLSAPGIPERYDVLDAFVRELSGGVIGASDLVRMKSPPPAVLFGLECSCSHCGTASDATTDRDG